VRPGDAVQGGVALRTRADEVLVHPFVYRVVCLNGAIRAHATATARTWRSREEASDWQRDAVLEEVREAILACAEPKCFHEGLGEMRRASQVGEVDILLQLSQLLDQGVSPQVFRELVQRFEKGHDRSLFGWMNAITARARESRSGEERWRLEELGGGVGARLRVKPRKSAPGTCPVGV